MEPFKNLIPINIEQKMENILVVWNQISTILFGFYTGSNKIETIKTVIYKVV